jgi:serine/threonine protein kinase
MSENKNNIPEIPDLSGKYKNISIISQTDRNSTFRAQNSTSDEWVFIKMLGKSKTSEPDAIRQFHNEPTIINLLNQRVSENCVVPVLGVSVFDGQPYFVEPLLKGWSLSQAMRRPACFNLLKTSQFIEKCLEILVQIHNADIVHGDISPENIFVITDNPVQNVGVLPDKYSLCFVDFESSRRIDGTENRLGLPITGKAPYMAPELVKGSSLSPKSDLYSLGILFYEMLVGSRPYAANSVDDIYQLNSTSIKPIPFSLGVPQLIENFLFSFIELNPMKRLETAASALSVLRRYLELYQGFCNSQLSNTDFEESSVGSREQGVYLEVQDIILSSLRLDEITTSFKSSELGLQTNIIKVPSKSIISNQDYVERREISTNLKITLKTENQEQTVDFEEFIKCNDDLRISELMDELQQIIEDVKPNIIKLEPVKDDFLEKIYDLKNTLFYKKDDFEKFEELLKNIDVQEKVGLNAYVNNNQHELTECLMTIEKLKGYIDKTVQKGSANAPIPLKEIVPIAAKQFTTTLEELIKMCLSEVLKSEARESIFELNSIPDSFRNDEEASDHRSTLQHANELVERMKEEIKKANKEVPKFFEANNTINSRSHKVPISRIDLVHFSVSSPPAVQPGKQIIVDVWAHLEQQRAEVASRVQQAKIPTEAPPVIRPKGPFKIERGTMLFVRLKFQDLIVEPSEDVILWEGEIGNASFVVSVPAEISKGIRIGSLTVHCEGGFQIARIPLQLLIADEVVHTEPIEQTLHRVRKAFVSYARADLDEVLSRIQGMQKIMPDLDVFLDVVNLRSGEDWEKRLWNVIPESDVFYLFWSAAAKESTWVEKEWRCALSSRGVDFIDPVPLISPKEVPPPEELSKMHFNDWSLAYRRGKPEISI